VDGWKSEWRLAPRLSPERARGHSPRAAVPTLWPQGSGKVKICPIRTTGRVGPSLRWQAARMWRHKSATADQLGHFVYFAGYLALARDEYLQMIAR
jgi:hypothetical protein